jgi:hypothetical protein
LKIGMMKGTEFRQTPTKHQVGLVILPLVEARVKTALRNKAVEADPLAGWKQVADAYVHYREAKSALNDLLLPAAPRRWTATTAKNAVMSAVAATNQRTVSNVAEELDTTGGSSTGVSALDTTEASNSTTTGPGSHGTGYGPTTSHGGGSGSGTTVSVGFYYRATCDASSELFEVVVQGCTDLSPHVSTICATLDIPALLCPYASISASCSSGMLKGDLYFSELE